MTKSIPYPAAHPLREYPLPPTGVPSLIPSCDLSEQGGEPTTNSTLGGEWYHRCVNLVPPPPALFGNSSPNNDRTFSFHFSYLGTTLRQANIEPMPSISDVRRVITEFAILPLGDYLSVIVILTHNFKIFIVCVDVTMVF